MEEKIEEAYNFTAGSLIKGTNFGSASESVSEYLWSKYQKNAIYYHQALINMLYSLQKLKGNEDIDLFDTFLMSRYNYYQFVSFVAYREIFQNVAKIIIFGKRS